MPERPGLRRAGPDDLAELMRLEEAAFDPPRRTTPRSMRLSLRSPHQSVWVVDAPGGGLAALLVLWHRRGSLRVYDVATHPGHRGRGLAGALVAHAEELARHDGARRVVLEAGTDAPGLVEWYTRRGYRTLEHLPDYYGPGRGAVRMEKRLEG